MLRLQRQDAVEHAVAIERADHVIIGTRLDRPAAILVVVLLQHDGDVGILHSRGGTQPPTHLEPREIVHHPVDESADRSFDQPPRSIGIEPREGVAQIAVFEVWQIACHRVGQEYVDRTHAAVTPPVRWQRCRSHMTRM